MKLFRAIVVALCLACLVLGCSPRNPDTDPKVDDLDLKIDEGTGGDQGK